jgi:hypothetical protein
VKGDNESDEEIENVSDNCGVVKRFLIQFETDLNHRKTKKWQTKRWMTMATTRTTISTTAKVSTMKMTIWTTGMVLSTRSSVKLLQIQIVSKNSHENMYRKNNEK